MIVLGVSGFEDEVGDPEAPTCAEASGADGAALTFRYGAVPLQGFPLGAIGIDSAAALLVDGTLAATAAEVRVPCPRHGPNQTGQATFPRRAIRDCLEQAGIGPNDIDVVAHDGHFDEKAIDARFLRVGAAFPLAERGMVDREYQSAFRRRLAPAVIRRKLEESLGRPLGALDVVQVPHHAAHAAGAYQCSGFDEALIVTLDGDGEAASGLWSFGLDGDIVPGGETQLPTSLGTLYRIVAAYLGLAPSGGDQEITTLSEQGDVKPFAPVFEALLQLGEAGAYSTAPMARADLHPWLLETLGAIEEPGRFTTRSTNVAAALRYRVEEAVLHHLGYLRRETRLDRLCLSGGVGLNPVVHRVILRSGLFRKVFARDAEAHGATAIGTALGAALHVQRTLGAGAELRRGG